ncbi:hypothetical protein WDZ11_22125 (plasmid) [Roseomonas mucosa]|uniref:hypothetical protein n=1 Tax=Roseomonas mucosa TaxID=207340 RepID=UPI0030D5C69A
MPGDVVRWHRHRHRGGDPGGDHGGQVHHLTVTDGPEYGARHAGGNGDLGKRGGVEVRERIRGRHGVRGRGLLRMAAAVPVEVEVEQVAAERLELHADLVGLELQPRMHLGVHADRAVDGRVAAVAAAVPQRPRMFRDRLLHLVERPVAGGRPEHGQPFAESASTMRSLDGTPPGSSASSPIWEGSRPRL